MTLNYRGKNIVGLSHGGKRIVKRYRGDQLVWSAYVPEGTVLWKGDDSFQSYMENNVTLSLAGVDFSKIQNGIRIVFSKKIYVRQWSGTYPKGAYVNENAVPQPLEIPVSSFGIGKDTTATVRHTYNFDVLTYKIHFTPKGTNSLYIGNNVVLVQSAVQGSTVGFTNVNGDFYASLIIDSITAY